jgi:hypothetical protein
MDAEYYHFLSIQIKFITFLNFLNSCFFGSCLMFISYFSMDWTQMNEKFGTHFLPSGFLLQFAFGCDPKYLDYWDMANSDNLGLPRLRAETNFSCQITYIFLASTFQIIVLYNIPYYFNRFPKNEK